MRPLSLAALLVLSTAVIAQTPRPVRVESASRPLRDIEAERWGDPGHCTIAPAVLGKSLVAEVDHAAHPGATFPVIVGHPATSSVPVDELGERLVDVTPSFAVPNRNAIDYVVGN